MKNAVVPATSTQRRRTASASNGGRRVRSPVGTLVGNALTLLFSTLCVVSSETPGRNRPPAGNLVSLAAGAVSGGFKVDCLRRISSAVTAGPRGSSLTDPDVAAAAIAAPWPRSVLLVASSGGHLAQLLALAPWWSERRRVWVTFDTPDARSQLGGEDAVWAFYPTRRSLRNLCRNLWLAVRTVPRVRPDIVVSTGAGVALPFFLAARFRRIPTVYVEVYDRIDTRTLTGRLCRPFTTLFCVQWEEQLRLYPGAELIGQLP